MGLVIEGTAPDACFVVHRMLWNEENSMVEGSYALNKRLSAPHYASKKTNDMVLGLVVLKGMLLNSVEQLSIADLRRNPLRREARIPTGHRNCSEYLSVVPRHYHFNHSKPRTSSA